MDNEQYQLAHCPDRVPTLLLIHHSVLAKYQVRIGEDPRCHFEVDAAVLYLVGPILGIIPFKSHAVIRNV